MKTTTLAFIGVTLLASTSAFASADLAKAKNCVACHAPAAKTMGPSIQELAAKYKGQKGVEATLVQKVLKGGTGSFGTIAMPPQNVSADEATSIVKWMLSGG